MSNEYKPLTDAELAAIRERTEMATPGPWYIRFLDDSHFMNLVAVCTTPDSGQHEALPYHDQGGEIRKSIIATTLYQADAHVIVPVSVETENWDEDAEFIAHAREDIPRLLAEIERLRNELSLLCPIADLDVITSLKTEKQLMMERIAELEADNARLKRIIECNVCVGPDTHDGCSACGRVSPWMSQQYAVTKEDERHD